MQRAEFRRETYSLRIVPTFEANSLSRRILRMVPSFSVLHRERQFGRRDPSGGSWVLIKHSGASDMGVAVTFLNIPSIFAD